MNQAQALYQLQVIDLEIADRKARLKAIEAHLANDTRVQRAEEELATIEAELAPWRARVQDLELEIQTLTTKATGVENRLYSGKVSNPKELQDMQEEIASLKRRRVKLDDELLEAMIEVENGQEQRTGARLNLEQARDQWQADQQSLLDEQRAIDQSLAELTAQRDEAVQSIGGPDITLYNQLIRSKQGHAVSRLADSACQMCGEAQTTAVVQKVRQGQGLSRCSNCGRILVLP